MALKKDQAAILENSRFVQSGPAEPLPKKKERQSNREPREKLIKETINFPAGLHKIITAHCKDEYKDFSQMVRDLVIAGLKNKTLPVQ